MRKAFSLLLLPTFLYPAMPVPVFAARQEAAKNIQPSRAAADLVRNEDVLAMVGAKFAPEAIIAKIKSSACDFDASPEALRKLKDEGTSDEIIMAMIFAPKPGTAAGAKTSSPQGAATGKVAVTVPEGSLIELETAYTINSQYVRAGDAVSFRVVNPVKVGGVTVIEPGATATARVVKASRGGHFGRAGRLVFEMHEVTAVDGTRVPVRFAGRVVGDSKGAKVATRIALTGLAFGPLAPLALLNGFKRGENAILPEGKRFEVYASGSVVVSVNEK